MKLILLLVCIEFYRQCSGYDVKDVLPFLVKIKAKSSQKNLDCSGTILAPRVVLTSAHCVDGFRPPDVTVIHTTETQVNEYETALVILHPLYKRSSLGNDIALLQIVESFIKPWVAVKLKNLNQSECTYFQIAGWSESTGRNTTKWGVKSSGDRPVIAPVKLISNDDCNTVMKGFGGTLNGNEKYCGVTNDDGECFSGPGGPLLCSETPRVTISMKMLPTTTEYVKLKELTGNETLGEPIDLLETMEETKMVHKREAEDSAPVVQVGVISWGKSCSQVPIVYVKTEQYHAWISQHLMHVARKNGTVYKKFTFLTPLDSSSSSFRRNMSFATNVVISIAVAIVSCSRIKL
ncbi:hypothetical protein RUM44_010709 [Polyplax serrata]|uniref:Peptidase S1 domain-containing protein n=1 Tax=Polyplax serrata TaxID=468196 RepID=A0ABR1AMY9_POLSC